MRNIIMYKKGQRSWTRYIQKRVTKANKNFLAVFTGQTGIGKTLGAIEESISIDPLFDVEQQLAFSFSGVMRIINNFSNKQHPLSKKKYKIVIYDEPQIDLSNRDWQSKANKLFNFLLSTFRHQNIIMFFCLPYLDFLDSASVKLLHAEFKCRGWNEKKKKIAEVVGRFNYWRVTRQSYKTIENQEATWFIDPPYVYGGKFYRYNKIDYKQLIRFCLEREGEVIVCENSKASWLPFEELVANRG
ncbi:hypothetical protein LCGC14_2679510, partial [marine sediment metagenome]